MSNSVIDKYKTFESSITMKGSHYKIGDMLHLIRGKTVSEAKKQLMFLRSPKAKQLLDLLNSCVSNAVYLATKKDEDLTVLHALANRATSLKRFHARGRGRSSVVYKKYTSAKIILKSVN